MDDATRYWEASQVIQLEIDLARRAEAFEALVILAYTASTASVRFSAYCLLWECGVALCAPPPSDETTLRISSV